MPVARGRQQTASDMLFGMAEEIEATVEAPAEHLNETPLWEPLEAPEGRGLVLADGRTVSRQRAALESLADELFYGGAGGGGKTDLLLGLALTRHHASVIFRREFTQFKGAEGMIERSREIVGLRGRLTEGRVWRDLPGGRAVEFGAVEHDDDKLKYKGRPHDLKGFDELPEFSESLYRFLIGWLRTKRVGQRTRVVGTGNPPVTEEGRWVIRYWAPWLDETHPHPAKEGELRWFATQGDRDIEVPGPARVWVEGQHGDPGEWVKPRSRTFIGARVEDNPYYMRTGYIDVLNSLPEPLRSQMRYGNFRASSPDDPWQVIPTAWVLLAQKRWTPDGGKGLPLTRVGNDPSRGGQDEFVIAKRHDHWVAPLVVHAATEAPDGPTGAALIHRAIGGNTTVPVQIDIIGTAGSSVYDHALGLHLQAVALVASEKSVARDRSGKLGFTNQRSEWHWRVRELLDPDGGQDIALPPDPQLRSDLCAPRWRPTPRGIQVEPKEDIKARLGRSPDRGEAVIYCLIHPAAAKKKQYRSVTW